VDLEHYAHVVPQASDLETIRRQVRTLAEAVIPLN